jgi:hypothetical protein
MDLSTMRYLEPAPDPVSTKPAGSEDMAWTEVTKGLLTVFAGYLLGILNVGAMLGVLWFATEGFKNTLDKVKGDQFSVLLIGSSVLFFSAIFSAYLVLRGNWRCVVNAPERRSAKWLMFASTVCICAGPTLNVASALVHDVGKKPDERASEVDPKPSFEKTAIRYVSRVRDNDLASFLQLASGIITPLGPVFFVLFLRAIHRCLENFLAARFTELYLMFLVLMIVGSLAMLLDPRVKIKIDLLAGLSVATLVASAWYLLLILGTVFGISAHLNAPRTVERT